MEPIGWVERLGRWSSGRGPLYVLLAARIRALIDDGDLPPGSALPPDRALAAALAVGRGTVVAAYDQLAVEGRITRRQGSGTRVAGDPDALSRSRETTAPREATAQTPAFLHLLEPGDGVLLLACAAPDAPPADLVDAYARAVPRLAGITGDIGYHPMGHPELRRAIAERYRRRGAPTAVDQVLVTSGGQQALSLLARALLRPGDRVLVESPTYSGALEAFREEGALPRGLPVGLDGLAAAAAEHRPVLAYVIASFHNPTGAVLPALRRTHLVRTAAASGVVLVDDETLADLGFPGAEEPPPPLAAHDDRVVTIGSLSKAVWGGLRVGWVRAPAPLVARLGRLRAMHDLGGNIPAQLAATELLGRLDEIRHRDAARRQARHDHLRAELARHLPGWHAPAVPGGQTLWVRLPHGDGTSFAQTALRHGVAVLPGSTLDADAGSHEYLRLHFIAPPDALSEAVRRLAAAWSAYRPRPHRAPASPTLAI